MFLFDVLFCFDVLLVENWLITVMYNDEAVAKSLRRYITIKYFKICFFRAFNLTLFDSPESIDGTAKREDSDPIVRRRRLI